VTAAHRLREVLLTLGAVLGALCLASLVAAVAFDVKPLVLRSGSMAPEIPTGALALAREVPAAEVEVGDVVSVVAPSGVRVTHRVVEIASDGPRRALTLQGDANPTPDADPYVVRQVDRVLVDAPGLGYAVAWASGPVGRFLGGVLVGAVLLLSWPGRGARPPRPRHLAPRPARRGVRAALGAALTFAVVAGVGVGVAQPALAAFADSATVTAGTFAGYDVPVPVLSCSGGLGSATISWTAPSSPYVPDYTARNVSNGATLTVNTSGSTRTVVITSGLLSTLLGENVPIEITAHAPGPGTWTEVAVQVVFRGLLGLTVSCVG
jgi:signal peptidase I